MTRADAADAAVAATAARERASVLSGDEHAVSLVIRNTFIEVREPPAPRPRRRARSEPPAPSDGHAACAPQAGDRRQAADAAGAGDASDESTTIPSDGGTSETSRGTQRPAGGKEHLKPAHRPANDRPAPRSRVSSTADTWASSSEACPPTEAAEAAAAAAAEGRGTPQQDERRLAFEADARAVVAAALDAAQSQRLGLDASVAWESAPGVGSVGIVTLTLPWADAGVVNEATTRMQDALRQVASGECRARVMGYKTTPFLPMPEGFAVMLGELSAPRGMCRGAYGRGFCLRGKGCSWRHPRFLAQVNFKFAHASPEILPHEQEDFVYPVFMAMPHDMGMSFAEPDQVMLHEMKCSGWQW